MYVIPGRISEEDVLRLREPLFQKLASCCTKLVLIDIKRYLANPDKNPECAEIVQNTFSNQLFLAEIIKDKSIMGAIQTVERLYYDSVTADVPLEELQKYQECIDIVNKCQYSQPYRSAISSVYIKDVILSYKEAGFKDIAKKIDVGKSLFTEPVNARAVGTPFKNINYAEERLSVIRPGIKFLIEMKERGVQPIAWRHL